MTRRNVVCLVSRAYYWPFVLITSLFLLWGFARAILDVLNKHFQLSLGVSRSESALLQVTVYGAYFLMALPAGLLISRYGTRKGVITGLSLFAAGAFLFVPAGALGRLLWDARPAVRDRLRAGVARSGGQSVRHGPLGDPSTAAGRLNRAQSFNGLGSILGALLGGVFFFSDVTAPVGPGKSPCPTPYWVCAFAPSLSSSPRLRLPEVVVPADVSTPVRSPGAWTKPFSSVFSPCSATKWPKSHQYVFHQLCERPGLRFAVARVVSAFVRRPEPVHGGPFRRQRPDAVRGG